MISVVGAIGVAILTFAGGLLGLRLKKMLPEQHSVENARDMIGSVMGLVTLLLALVLGTIVGSAYFFSSTQQSELQSLSSNSLQLDKALAQYGPETKPARDRLKQALVRSHDLFWSGADVDPQKLTVGVAMAGLQPMDDYLGSLDPKTPAQNTRGGRRSRPFRPNHADAALDVAAARQSLLQAFAGHCGGWSFFLFCGFGLLSKPNATTLAALAFGALAVASAIFLILELSQPYTGPVSHFAGRARTDDRGHRQIGERRRAKILLGASPVIGLDRTLAFAVSDGGQARSSRRL